MSSTMASGLLQVAACEGGEGCHVQGGRRSTRPSSRQVCPWADGCTGLEARPPWACRSSGSVPTTTWPSPPPEHVSEDALHPSASWVPPPGHTGAPAPPAWAPASAWQDERTPPAWSEAAVPAEPPGGAPTEALAGTMRSPRPLPGPASAFTWPIAPPLQPASHPRASGMCLSSRKLPEAGRGLSMVGETPPGAGAHRGAGLGTQAGPGV